MERRRSGRRRHTKLPFAQRAKEHCRQFTAFLFSNVGIIILVVAYMIGGKYTTYNFVFSLSIVFFLFGGSFQFTHKIKILYACGAIRFPFNILMNIIRDGS